MQEEDAEPVQHIRKCPKCGSLMVLRTLNGGKKMIGTLVLGNVL